MWIYLIISVCELCSELALFCLLFCQFQRHALHILLHRFHASLERQSLNVDFGNLNSTKIWSWIPIQSFHVPPAVRLGQASETNILKQLLGFIIPCKFSFCSPRPGASDVAALRGIMKIVEHQFNLQCPEQMLWQTLQGGNFKWHRSSP